MRRFLVFAIVFFVMSGFVSNHFGFMIIKSDDSPIYRNYSTTKLYAKEVKSNAVPVITVDGNDVFHQMQGGIGAVWHAIETYIPIDTTKLEKMRRAGPRGSGVGGNPDSDDDRAWQRVYEIADWVGLDWERVEIEHRMYEPEKGKFDFSNEEMKTLYRILDWCESRQVPVFLIQRCGFVEWNTFPGMHPVQSGPKDLSAYANGLAVLFDYLINTKNYSCIKYIGLVNEPGVGWFRYPAPDGKWKCFPLDSAKAAVRSALDNKGLEHILIAGPDRCHSRPPADMDEFRKYVKYVGALDTHSYNPNMQVTKSNFETWVKLARELNKPYFITEFWGNGEWKSDWTKPRSWESSFLGAEKIIVALNAGVDAMCRWDFIDRGDIGGEWQLIRTWDMQEKEMLPPDEYAPEPYPFYCLTLFTRFMPMDSKILTTHISGNEHIRSAAIRTPKDQISIFITNNDEQPASVQLSLDNMPDHQSLYLYQIDKQKIDSRGFELKPSKEIKLSGAMALPVDLPASSVTTLSTVELMPDEKGLIID